MCALCCQNCATITVCGKCKERYCAECIDALFVRHMRSDMGKGLSWPVAHHLTSSIFVGECLPGMRCLVRARCAPLY